MLLLFLFSVLPHYITLSTSSSDNANTKIGNWDIGLTNMTGDVPVYRSKYSVPISTLVYETYPNKLNDIDFSFYDQTCKLTNPVTDGVVHEISKTYFQNKTNFVILAIGINTNQLASSNILNSDGGLSFCTRADLTGRSVGFDDSVSFHETIISLKYNLKGDFVVEKSFEIMEAPSREVQMEL